jgi:hypothetical protein
MENVFFKSFHVAGFTFYEGALVFPELKIGSRLELKTEPQNIHDGHAVALYFSGRKIGFIPRRSNQSVSKLLNAGYQIFEAVIQQLAPEEYPEQQVRVALFIKPNQQPE